MARISNNYCTHTCCKISHVCHSIIPALNLFWYCRRDSNPQGACAHQFLKLTPPASWATAVFSLQRLRERRESAPTAPQSRPDPTPTPAALYLLHFHLTPSLLAERTGFEPARLLRPSAFGADRMPIIAPLLLLSSPSTHPSFL